MSLQVSASTWRSVKTLGSAPTTVPICCGIHLRTSAVESAADAAVKAAQADELELAWALSLSLAEAEATRSVPLALWEPEPEPDLERLDLEPEPARRWGGAWDDVDVSTDGWDARRAELARQVKRLGPRAVCLRLRILLCLIMVC